MSAWRRQTLEERLSLTPATLRSREAFREAIRQSVRARLLMYDRWLRGAPVRITRVAFLPLSDAESVDPTAPALRVSDWGFLHLRLQVEALLFAPLSSTAPVVPRPQTTTAEPVWLPGRVVFLGARHIALRVYGVFHASIGREDIPGKYRLENGVWRRLDGSAELSEVSPDLHVGQVVRFRVKGVQYALNGMFLIRGSMYAKGTKGSKSERRAQAVLRLAEADEFDADAAAQLDAEVPAFLRTARAVSEGTTDRAVLMQVPEAVFPWHRPAVATASTPVASRKAPSTAASGPDADDALLQEWAAWSSAAGASPSPAGPGYDAASPTLPRHPSPRALADELLMGVSDIDDDPLAELLQKVSGKRAHHAAHAPKRSTGDVRHRERRRHNEW
ncbi:hypothetical protein CDCA_CDCA02G0497 [Cyanidium caldarium]|uniref:S1 motif domain-containing protein n=1 Tax=Cyanidium caldarium TaxID=2771 RepID=A0AAV9IQG0_CYACA|nr:hypothetical protein CDCA_CDCA02G0497 [Cyanidium caldarium]